MIICVDLDGTLYKGTAWNENDIKNSVPNPAVVRWVNQKYKKDFIVIWTARRPQLYFPSIQKLWQDGIFFHALACGQGGKCPADLYLDDKSFTPQEIILEEMEDALLGG